MSDSVETPASGAERAKHAAASRALELVRDGMRLGLGSGSTAAWFVRLLAERIAREGLSLSCVATSSATTALAAESGVPLLPLDEVGGLDLTVDGTDEFDPQLNLIKGGGAALLQEKIVASVSKRLVIVADPGKQVLTLGAFPLPVEVVRFGWGVTRAQVAGILAAADVGGTEITVRGGEETPLVTDEGHHILDLHLKRIVSPVALSRSLNGLPGMVETGLFAGMADSVILGREDGTAEVVLRVPPPDALETMRNEDA